MAISSKIDAQHRSDQIKTFQKELELLESEGVLNLDRNQKSTLHAHHSSLLSAYEKEFGIDTTAKAKQLSKGMRSVSFFGALAFGTALFFLFYQFWGTLGTPTQAGILLFSPLLLLGVLYWLLGKDKEGYFVKMAATVALAAFVLNLTMLAKIFNIPPSQNAFLLWAGFAFLLAYATGARLLLAFGIVGLASFMGAKTGTWSGTYWLGFGENPEVFFPAAILVFSFAFIPHVRFKDFLSTYRISGLLLALLPILVLGNWGAASFIPATKESIEAFYQTAGFVLSGGAVYWGIKKEWGDVANTGTVFFTIFLYTKMYDWFWEWMPKYLFFLLAGAIALGVLFILKLLRDRLTKEELA